jgi:RNA recognition motif-containing protein
MSEADLMAVFAPIGGLAEVAVLRGQDGRSKGCAFVSYLRQPQAEQAVQQLNGKALPGDPRAKPLVVKYATQR